jgi:hypothetical protein
LAGAGVCGSRPRRGSGEGIYELAADWAVVTGLKGVCLDGPATLLGAISAVGIIAREEGYVVSLGTWLSSSSASVRSGAAIHCDATGTSSVIFVARLMTAALFAQIYRQWARGRWTYITHLVAICLQVRFIRDIDIGFLEVSSKSHMSAERR